MFNDFSAFTNSKLCLKLLSYNTSKVIKLANNKY